MLRRTRLAVVRTNVWPISALYRAIYAAGASLVARFSCARFPHTFEAVYLRGSLAMDLLVPGLSDVDLFFVLRDEVPPERHEAAQVFYRRLAAWCPVFDPHPWMLRWADVRKLHDENPSLRFRVMEGRQAFRLLRGRDRLGEIAPPDALSAALSQLYDLKSRLTYFNAFCLTRGPADELEARRREYLLFKLTVDLARASLFLSNGESIFHRGEVVRRLLDPTPSAAASPAIGDDVLLRAFVAHTIRYRLRRRFADGANGDPEALEAAVLRRALDLLGRFYARPELRTCPILVAEAEHFYADGRFLPTGHPVRRVPEARLGDYRALRQRVLDGNAAGVDTLLEVGDLLVNLSNTEPRLGNCTVVALAPTPA